MQTEPTNQQDSKLTPADREWVRRQARAARALAAEQRRWVQHLDTTRVGRFVRSAPSRTKFN